MGPCLSIDCHPHVIAELGRPLQVYGDIGKLYLSLGGVVQQKVGTFRQARTRPSAYLPLIIWGNGRGCGTRVRTRLSWCGAPLPNLTLPHGSPAARSTDRAAPLVHEARGPTIHAGSAHARCAMNARSYSRLAALLFAIIAVVQFIRAAGGWQIVVNGTTSVPVWASWIACVVIAGLAWVGFDASRRS